MMLSRVATTLKASKKDLKKETSPLSAYVKSRLEDSKQVRRAVAPWGKISIDRQLPFLVVYRKPEGRTSLGDERFVMGEASFLTASGAESHHPGIAELVSEVASVLSEKFSAFLIIEVWISHLEAKGDMPERPPQFRLHLPSRDYLKLDIDGFASALRRIRVQRQESVIEMVCQQSACPPGLMPLMGRKESVKKNIYFLGVEIFDVYRDSETNLDFPLMLQTIRRGFSRALKRFIFEFTHQHTTYRPRNFQVLGRRSLVKAVWEVDRQLADLSRSFDLVLCATPTNYHAAFEEFKKKHFEAQPRFLYRPVVVEPAELKRVLYSVPIERIEDPALAQLFRSQRQGLDRKLTMLADRGTKKFLYGSMQLYGVPEDSYIELARHVLATVPVDESEEPEPNLMTARMIAEEAKKEIAYYRNQNSDFGAQVEVRDDIAGIMVSNGNLLINHRLKIPDHRVRALLQHEIGTHVVTYHNGRAQPFQQLATGLIGYDEVQEGLAVMAEFLAGGLSNKRMRILAGRVVGVGMMLAGATFVETYRELVHRYRFKRKPAFSLVMRVYRAGGFTKDAIYMRGLIWLFEYLKDGGNLETLLLGKMPQAQLPLIRELRWRNVLKPPSVMPRYLEFEEAKERLALIREGMTLEELSRAMKK
ncbi:MAG: flavohemoglobin expression-modulating QEGLA motif protein [Cyanobacteria bacterium HKST-UBA02]|nr:flavohemoglobin expression-modulating QEGLA motif protein [Cyanobacteria bacterium HKST-UBA02]